MEILYRMADRLLWEGGEMVIDLMQFRVMRRTPKGAWISRNPVGFDYPRGKDRFVLDGEGKRFAYPTQELALESFKARKRSQIGRLETQMTIAKAALKAASGRDFQPNRAFYDESLTPFTCY